MLYISRIFFGLNICVYAEESYLCTPLTEGGGRCSERSARGYEEVPERGEKYFRKYFADTEKAVTFAAPKGEKGMTPEGRPGGC
ncbi:hypothetical protein RYH73_18190, partial [Olivibacter sp. CPCC 100613]|uniref:hypothetical protein n=1 Tax=Olivibacter sp. CPCC 100613 TaxID=3079931 RepID=UPI002FF5D516